MAKLILIKHASPLVMPGIASEKWRLSDKGRQQCTPLAESILPYAPARIVSSLEPKAAETGELIAARLGIPFEAAAGLHEHDRSNVPHLQSREFISLVELFFRRPSECVLGKESADEALLRFEQAVHEVLLCDKNETVAVVSHGTVIALMLARGDGVNGFDRWRQMALPSYAVLDRETLAIEKVVDRL